MFAITADNSRAQHSVLNRLEHTNITVLMMIIIARIVRSVDINETTLMFTNLN